MENIIENIINKEIIYWSIYSNLFLFVFLSIASYFDIKEFKIPNKLNLSFLIGRFVLIPFISIGLENIYGLLVGLLLILIPAMIINKPMGGDIKMSAVLGFYLGIQNIIVLLIGTVVVSIVPAILKKRQESEERKDIPLAPFVLISFIIVNIISCIL